MPLRPLPALFAVTVAAAVAAGCARPAPETRIVTASGAVSQPASNDPWASLPAPLPMPAAAPDDPAAYRAVRFRIVLTDPFDIVSGGRVVPWLDIAGSGGGTNATGSPFGPWFGYRELSDGRRRMMWFTRLVEGPRSPPPPPLGQAEPRRELRPEDIPPPPEEAVLDVAVLPAGLQAGVLSERCGGVIIWDDQMTGGPAAAWRLDYSTGSIEKLDDAEVSCPAAGSG